MGNAEKSSGRAIFIQIITTISPAIMLKVKRISRANDGRGTTSMAKIATNAIGRPALLKAAFTGN